MSLWFTEWNPRDNCLLSWLAPFDKSLYNWWTGTESCLFSKKPQWKCQLAQLSPVHGLNIKSILKPHTHKAASVHCFLSARTGPQRKAGRFGAQRGVTHTGTYNSSAHWSFVCMAVQSLLPSLVAEFSQCTLWKASAPPCCSVCMHSVFECICSQRHRGWSVWDWNRDSFLCCAALSTASCCMLACRPQNESFPQEENQVYENTAEISDLPIRPSLSKLSPLHSSVVIKPCRIHSKSLFIHTPDLPFDLLF